MHQKKNVITHLLDDVSMTNFTFSQYLKNEEGTTLCVYVQLMIKFS